MAKTTGLRGCQPRFGTPRSDRPSLGAEVAEVGRRLGITLMPWQQHVLDVALEFDPDTNRLVYDEIDVTVPRQSGKTTFVGVKTVHRLTVMAARLGPQRATYTAQTRLAARKKLEREFAEQLRSSPAFAEILNVRARPKRSTEFRVSMSAGAEHIQIGRSLWSIDAPSRTGSHGETLDTGDIDEAFAHETDDVEQAIRPAQATRTDAQLWVFSTAGDEKSKYLWRKVKSGREACDSGDHGKVAYFEWSAADDADPSDPAVWRSCSPALGFTIDESFLSAEWDRALRKGQEGIDLFRRAYLNQWPVIPVLDDELRLSVVDVDAWAACEDPKSRITDDRAFAVAVSLDRSTATIGVSGRRADGVPHVEFVESRSGTRWVVDRVVELDEAWPNRGWVVDAGSPAGSLIPELTDRGVNVQVAGLRQYAQGFGQFFDLASSGGLRHVGQPTLGLSLAGASTRTAGDAKVWDRKHATVDITPLEAVTLALWGSLQPKDALDDPPAIYAGFVR